MAKLSVDIKRIAQLSPDEWAELYAFDREFTDATREQYEAGLRSYTDVVRIREARGGPLGGVGAVHSFSYELGGRVCWFQTAGMLRFRPHVRGRSIVQRQGFRQFLRLRVRHPLARIFLYYDTFSFRSFVMLARNFSRFWPHPDGRAIPPEVADFFARYGPDHYGEHWDGEAGVCRGTIGGKLLEGVARVEPDMLADLAVAFFVERNPGYTEGDRLPVLVPMDASNWWSVLRRARVRRRRSRS